MRTETKTINVYLYDELSQKAKDNVVYWLDFNPIEYETEDNEIKYQLFQDMDDNEISEHCLINEYEFTEHGDIY